MSKVFEYIGLFTLMCFSFFVTEKTSMMAKDMDEIMINIKKEYKDYEIEPKDATITDNSIIPGICGTYVNIDKSYSEMKKVGIYDSKLYQYDYKYPDVNILNNYDKYIIGGNDYKNYIYIFIPINDRNKTYLDKFEFENYNFIVSADFYLENTLLINELIEKNNSVIIEKSEFKKYKRVSKDYKKRINKNIFCYNPSSDNEFMQICSSNKSSTIGSTNLYEESYLLNIKKDLKKGVFYNFILNDELINNIKLIEDYIEQRGITRSNIENTLKEC